MTTTASPPGDFATFDPSQVECIEDPDYCEGTVEYRSVPGGSPVPRCMAHFQARMDRYETSIERYADSDVVPSWFDPSYAGERWDDE